MIEERTYDIAVARSRHDKTLRNISVGWADLVKKLKDTKRTPEMYVDYLSMPKEKQGEIKDVGGFVGGYLNAGSRKAGNVLYRSILTLDLDDAKVNFWDDFSFLFDCAAAVYSTHKHKTDKPRLRIVVPLSRNVQSDEYEAVARKVAEEIGIEQADVTTFEPHRLMYWPSTSKDGDFYFKEQPGEPLDVDSILAGYANWRDCSAWAFSSKINRGIRQEARKAGKPTEKGGIVGAFCRVYDIRGAIEKYLPGIYTPFGKDRYTYTGGTTSGGLVLYGDDFAFSHHATDPAGGRLCNSFDLVRLHRFGSMDSRAMPDTPINHLPSYKEMEELARGDSAVVQLIASERVREASDDFSAVDGSESTLADADWMEALDVDKRGNFAKSLKNIELILKHDTRICDALMRDDFNHTDVLIKDLPWRKKSEFRPFWDNEDDANLRCYLSREPWKMEGRDKIYDAYESMMNVRRFHPIRNYLNSLTWDGVARVDTLFVDYLGANDTELVRAFTRKTLTAAVARVMSPGVKWDYILTLQGGEGIGKSTILKRLGGEWFSDSFTNVEGKDAMEQVQRKWLIELGELTNYKKSSSEAYKAFLSKTDDTFRPAYGRKIETFPRQCVFFATTNEEYFLKGDTGNRRWWVIEVGKNNPAKSVWNDLSDAVVGQIWAEALHLYKSGEALYLPKDLELQARERQRESSESGNDERIGVINTFIHKLLPADWSSRTPEARRLWLMGGDPLQQIGLTRREYVCAVEILVECFGEKLDDRTKYRAREINAILRQMGLKELPRRRLPNYGLQRVFEVPREDDFDFAGQGGDKEEELIMAGVLPF